MTWEPRRVELNRLPCESGQLHMPTQIDEASDYDFVINLIYERSRIRLHDGKQQLIRARLGKRMRHHGFETLSQYCDYLRRTGDEDEITHMVDALSTNYTQFLREKDHFDFLVGTALPKLLGDRKKFNIWSAPCATGEEAYSIAFYLSEHFPIAAGWDWRIHATDPASMTTMAHVRSFSTSQDDQEETSGLYAGYTRPGLH